MSYNTEKSKALLARIEESKRDFEREVDSRRKLLAIIHERMEAAEPADPLLAEIDAQWEVLYRDYARYREQGGDARIAAMMQKRAEIEGKRAAEAKIQRERQARRDHAIRERQARRVRDEYEGIK